MAVKPTAKSARAAAKKPAARKPKAAAPSKLGAVSKGAGKSPGKAKTKAAPAAQRKPSRPAKPAEPRPGARNRAGKSLDLLRSALEKSGQTLTHWVDLLDKVGGPELGHGTLARILTATQHLDNWTANCLVLHYRGLYGFGESADLMDHQDRLKQLGKWK